MRPDRTTLCLKCGEASHRIRVCENPAKCCLWADAGHKSVDNFLVLLGHIVTEKEIDTVITSEQYWRTPHSTWFEDNKLVAAENGSDPGFAYLKSSQFTLVRCYLKPNDSMQEFQTKLDRLQYKA